MSKSIEKDINSYPFYSVGEVDVLTAEEIETAVVEWFGNLGLEEEIPESIEISCWKPISIDYSEVADDAIEHLTEKLYEDLDENYTFDQSYGNFKISEEKLKSIKSAIVDAIKNEFEVSLYNSVRTISVNPRDYIDKIGDN